ncbi:hypothetical protein KEM48_011971 [Puccinia striiformis f. sp. tritici PST-130]|nr:hypothetical protein H4Q26_012799 [Puccinia striiformis f. sp. tritici PST-130]KAI9627894.1 hypothetical protein KEM48_011971 [Puccinia striiformis f. sp. tritici PST-130]
MSHVAARPAKQPAHHKQAGFSSIILKKVPLMLLFESIIRSGFANCSSGCSNWTEIWDEQCSYLKDEKFLCSTTGITVSKKNAQFDPMKPGYNPLDVYRRQEFR